MKRVLVVVGLLVVAIGAGAGGWYYVQQQTGERPDLLAHVPADTVFFAGYSEPSPGFDEMPDWVRELSGTNAEIPELEGEQAQDLPPAAQLYGGLLKVYQEAFEAEGLPHKRFGIPERSVVGVYTVGALPVLRAELEDAERFWAAIDDAEEHAEVEGEVVDDDTYTVRRYAIVADEEADGELYLRLATGPEFAVVTLEGTGIEDTALKQAMGHTQPEQALQQKHLDELAERHGVQTNGVGFIDHRRLVAGFTGEEGSRLADMINQLAAAWGDGEEVFEGIREDACSKDARAIAALWPRTVMGVLDLGAESGRIEQRFVIESTDEETLTQLRKLRGHVPQLVNGDGLAGAGLGLDVSQLVPVLQSLQKQFASAEFSCPALQMAQSQLAQAQIGPLSMFTAMLSDVRGVGLLFSDLGVEGGDVSQENMRAVVALATGQPQQLWSVLRSFGGSEVPEAPEMDGEPVDLSVNKVPGRVPRMRGALRENAVVLLLGDVDMPEAPVVGEQVTPNGVFSLQYDLGRFVDFMLADLESGAQSEAVNEEQLELLRTQLQAIKAVGLHFGFVFDVGEQGLRTDMAVEGKAD